MNLFAGGSLVFSQDWSADRLTQVSWSTAWTPPGEGIYNLDEAAYDSSGVTIAGPPFILYVDLTPPQVGLGTTSISVNEWANGGFIFLRGWFEEAAGLARLQARVERQGAAGGISDAWQDLPLPVGGSGEWQGYAYTGLVRPPVGEYITVTIRAVDHAGRQVEVTAVLWANAPEAFDLP